MTRDGRLRWTDVLDKGPIDFRSERWLTRETKVIAIGSCFARNLGRYLAALDVSVLSPEWGNHYHAPAIETELRRALNDDGAPCRWRDDNTGLIVDGYRHTIVADSEEALAAREANLVRVGREAFGQADAIIVTLGISEIWEFEVSAGNWTAIDQVPPADLVAMGRARCRFQSSDEIVRNLQNIDSCLVALMPRRQHTIITVSPIPLKQTFHNHDIRVSNLRSKSTLVAAVHQFVEHAAHWTYFPAFEHFAGAGPTEGSWQRDLRHPTSAAVTLVCHAFVEAVRSLSVEFATPPTFSVPAV